MKKKYNKSPRGHGQTLFA